MKRNLPRIMIAAIASGSGKTTITCALLKAMKDKGIRASSYKCGPDYIDPMFHTEVLGVSSTNLDIFLTGENTCRYLINKNSVNADISVIEGVMGYYDGAGGGMVYSSYHLAKITNTPVILIINCKGMSHTVAAVINGMVQYKSDSNIKGVILNHISDRMYAFYKEIIEKETGTAVLGYMPSLPECNFESRHLGLITAQEEQELDSKLQKLATAAAQTIDIDKIMQMANDALPLTYEDIQINKQFDVTIAVAKDRAFCFYYKDALELLESMGAKIKYFSPLNDVKMPKCDGFIMGGGYPELYLKQLSQNKPMLNDIKSKIEKGIPYIAECGGFMYLFRSVKDNENAYEMAGIVDGDVFMTKRLNRFGYITLTANRDNLLCNRGETINAHEFHYSDSSNNGNAFIARKPFGDKEWECILADKQRFIGYPHIHLLGNIKFAENFLNGCRIRKENAL